MLLIANPIGIVAFLWIVRGGHVAHNGLVAGSSPAGPTTRSFEPEDFLEGADKSRFLDVGCPPARALVSAETFFGLEVGVPPPSACNIRGRPRLED